MSFLRALALQDGHLWVRLMAASIHTLQNTWPHLVDAISLISSQQTGHMWAGGGGVGGPGGGEAAIWGWTVVTGGGTTGGVWTSRGWWSDVKSTISFSSSCTNTDLSPAPLPSAPFTNSPRRCWAVYTCACSSLNIRLCSLCSCNVRRLFTVARTTSTSSSVVPSLLTL